MTRSCHNLFISTHPLKLTLISRFARPQKSFHSLDKSSLATRLPRVVPSQLYELFTLPLALLKVKHLWCFKTIYSILRSFLDTLVVRSQKLKVYIRHASLAAQLYELFALPLAKLPGNNYSFSKHIQTNISFISK